jgi:hypothetical protein
VFDDHVDRPRNIFIVHTHGNNIMAVMGNRRRECTFFESKVFYKPFGDGCIVVAIDDNDLQEIPFRVAYPMPVFNLPFFFQPVGDQQSVQGFNNGNGERGVVRAERGRGIG